MTLTTALPITSGGTGLTTLTAGYIPYGNGTSAFNSTSNFNFDGTNLNVGTSSSLGKITSAGAAASYSFASSAASTAGAYYHATFNPAGGAQAGFIYSPTSSTTAYMTTSDYRLKENVVPMIGALDKIIQLKPCTYDWIANKTPGQGFIAHELQAIVPDCVSGEKDAVDEEGNPRYQGIDTSFLVATLTAAIQELNTKFEAYVASHP